MEGNLTLSSAADRIRMPSNLLMWLGIMMVISGVAAAVYAQLVGHHHAFANTREMPWGMLIGTYAYFAIISTGLAILAAFSHAFGGNRMAPLANRMVWLSIITLLAAFTVIGLEIENPWRLPLGTVLFPNTLSNIWWMGTLYGLAVGIMSVELLLILSGRLKAAVALGIIAAIAEALANSNLGSVFGSLHARPFWYGSQLPVFFLASAVLSGSGAVVIFTYYSHLLRKRPLPSDTFEALQTAGKIMVLMTFLIGLATAWKFANAYCGTEPMIRAADSLIKGPLATNFWLFEIGIGLVVPCLLLVVSRLSSIQALSAAALMVLVGQFVSRYNLVVAGQIVPNDAGYMGIPAYLNYSPAPAEYMLVVAGLGVVLLGFIIGEQYFDTTFNRRDGH